MSVFKPFKSTRPIVISEPDVAAAVQHLRSLPFVPDSPEAWDRKRFLDRLAGVVANAKVGDYFDVAPGVFAVIKPFACDLRSFSEAPEFRLQVWVSVRAQGTDPTKITILN